MRIARYLVDLAVCLDRLCRIPLPRAAAPPTARGDGAVRGRRLNGRAQDPPAGWASARPNAIRAKA